MAAGPATSRELAESKAQSLIGGLLACIVLSLNRQDPHHVPSPPACRTTPPPHAHSRLGRSRCSATAPIRMIVPVAAAGASDIVARIMADAMTPLLGRPIVAENIAGAGSTLGANAFQQTPPDGQTIYVPTNNHALMKLIYPQFAYDPAADFVAVALVSRQPFVLAVHTSVPAQTVPEFDRLAAPARRGGKLRHRRAEGGQLHGGRAVSPARQRGLHHRVLPRLPPPRAGSGRGRLDFSIDSPSLLMPLVRQGEAARARGDDGRRLDPVARPAGAAGGGRAGLRQCRLDDDLRPSRHARAGAGRAACRRGARRGRSGRTRASRESGLRDLACTPRPPRPRHCCGRRSRGGRRSSRASISNPADLRPS